MRGLTSLITGATDGIGKEAAIELAKKGCNLILIGRSKEKGDKVVEEIRNCLLYTSPSPRDRLLSRMPSSA